ncbi:MAG: T9SS type A sorting domain-containing protein [Bacteroidetes bacterium]|nr:T9SS type A sorting domain-containing protein [Bacteroidota bacterium]
MKKFTLLLGVLFITDVSFSQVLVKGISPAAVQMNFEYGIQVAEGGWPGETDDGTWGMTLDFNIPGTYVQAELVMVDDGTSGTNTTYGNLLSEEGCFPSPANAYAGKIAVIRRNTCNFAVKILEAQNAGAIAVIIVNREDALLGMLGIAPEGPQCTIPAVFLKSSDGNFLISEMQNGPVEMFIGSKIGVFNDDMGTSIADIVMPNELAKPAYLAQTGAEFPVDLGLWANNFGSNAQTGVTASVNIIFSGTGTSVYSQTSAPLNFAAPAGFVIDTQYFDLGTFAPATLSAGTYTVTYSLNIVGTDQDPSDNTFTFEYKLTVGGGWSAVYAKSRTDASDQPMPTTAYSLDETTTQYDDWEACIVFQDANAGARYMIGIGMTFSGRPVGFDIDFEVLEVRLYEWNDIFTDINTPPTFTALNQVTSATYFYDYASNGNLEGQNISVPFDAVWPLVDNKRYLFCVYNASDSIRIGYDTRIDYTATINNYLQPIAPVKTLPNGQPAEWFRDGFGWDATPAISATIDITSSINNIETSASIVPYPNPAANLLTVPVRKGIVGDVKVEIYDLAGKLVISENQTIGNEPLKVNVASIANGAYVFNLTFTDGSKDTFKVSVNR